MAATYFLTNQNSNVKHVTLKKRGKSRAREISIGFVFASDWLRLNLTLIEQLSYVCKTVPSLLCLLLLVFLHFQVLSIT